MGHGTGNRYTPQFTGQNVRSGTYACDIERSWLLDGCIRAVHSPSTKIDDVTALRRPYDARRLGCSKGGELNLIHNKRLDDLRLRQWRNDLDKRLISKNDRTFRNCVHVAAETELSQAFEKSLRKPVDGSQVIDRLFR